MTGDRSGRKRKGGTYGYTCLCGFHVPAREGKKKDNLPSGREIYINHRIQCAVVENAIYDEIERLSGLLDRFPRFLEYKKMASKNLPSITWVVKYLGAWSEVLVAVADRNNPDAALSIDEPTPADPASRVNFDERKAAQYDALPTNTFAVSSVRVVDNEIFCMLR